MNASNLCEESVQESLNTEFILLGTLKAAILSKNNELKKKKNKHRGTFSSRCENFVCITMWRENEIRLSIHSDDHDKVICE